MISREARDAARPSAFRIETQRSRALFGRWATHLLNQFYDQSAERRAWHGTRTALLIAAAAAAATALYAVLLAAYMQVSGAPLQLSAVLTQIVVETPRIVLLIGISGLLAFQAAGNYLADIFELKDTRVAWRFIQRLSTGIGQEVLHLRDGKIVEEDKNSPIVLIGGPGHVRVDYDTVALFERPDGTPHVVGPVLRRTRSGEGQSDYDPTAIALDGFERLREPIIHLRDQYIGSAAGQALTVTSRSLDGMPVSAADVRAVFSVRRAREGKAAEPSKPGTYPFDARDIEKIIYGQSVPVLTAGPDASGEPGAWTSGMQALITSALREFMSQNRLSEYVAGTGQSEMEQSEFLDDTILQKTLELSSDVSETVPLTPREQPKFHARTELSARFAKSNLEFARRSRERGLELHWIGVGTWTMPDENSSETVREKHLEAWRMNRDSLRRADEQTLESSTADAIMEEKLRLIQDTPIGSLKKIQAKYADKEVAIEALVQSFWTQIADALDLYYKGDDDPNELDTIERAVEKLEELLKIPYLGHMIGDGTATRIRPRRTAFAGAQTPPAPASKTEAQAYQALLTRLGGDYRVAEALVANEAKRHPELGREDLIRRILKRRESDGRQV
jgi:hypothetical protein